ncbi:RteC domain-containing protein [Flavobacteriaceae bacterium F89]|uniref:RteC domain-containing protein n=1 Tax=Cerina litoralis TaxID=2874477 RepID=A0AAE3ESR0_9FLAO|nr:RteC domain-containing protein [Cerina litoralis]MCG2459454.1 RteC domain-containing protein [Cerina litoralis]
MKLRSLSEELAQDLDEIKLQYEDILERAYRSIEVCRNLLSTLKKEILKDGFETIQEEIHFFKITKQIPLVQLIYFSEIHSFEIQFPKADKKSQRKCLKRKIEKLNRFFLYNLDFGRYVDSGATHFDKEYYTRDYLDHYHITTSKFYFQDPEFCTPRDMLLGKYQAYNSFIVYLDNRLFNLRNSRNGRMVPDPSKKLHWPFSNADYVELLYALCAKGLGRQDNLSMMKVSKRLQEIFDFVPKDIYKTFQSIKGRKNSRTLFLDELAISLLSEMDKSEE